MSSNRSNRRLREIAADTVAIVLRGGYRAPSGAWVDISRGVFGNDPRVVADAWSEALGQTPCFDHVVFAVLDRLPGAPTLRAFADVLASSGSG